MQSKVKLVNGNQNWNSKKRYKINETVNYLGFIYQNITGNNSSPELLIDWITSKTNINSEDIENALGYTPENAANKGIPNGYASLGSDGFTLLSEMNPSTLERLVVVADQTARFALTTAIVQNGDTVKQSDTGIMYYVKDDTNLNNVNGYEVYRAGTSASVPWTGVTGTPTSLAGYGIIPASGDYTTALVTETINKNYQTDLQKLYNDATSSIQNQLDSKQPLISTVNLGTQNTLTKFGALGLLNSSITDSGTLVSTTSRLTVGIGTPTETNIWVSRDITGAVNSQSILVDGVIKSDVTTAAFLQRTKARTQATAFTLPSLYHYHAQEENLGAESIVTNQYGFYADVTLLGAVNNYGFYGAISSGSNRWNLYMNGTASNYFNGALGIGTNAPLGKLTAVTGTGSTINVASQPSASIVLGNLGTGGNEMPVISGRTSNNTGLTLMGTSAELNTTPDMRFEIRENDNTDFTDRTTPGFRFTRFGTNLVEILRNGNTTFIGNVTVNNLTLNSVLKLKSYTVATLPVGVANDMAVVTDALAPTYNGTVVGGGAVRVPVFHDGVSWKT